MRIKVDEIIPLQTRHGLAEAISFKGLEGGKEHLIIAMGEWRNQLCPLVRIHSECLTGDVFGSCRCDCGPQLDEAMRTIGERGGLVVYLRQEGRGIGLANKIKAYRLQDEGYNTYEANEMLGFGGDQRSFIEAAQMLRAIDIKKICLLSNNPRKGRDLTAGGLEIVERVFTQTYISEHNQKYLTTKADLGGHDGLRKGLAR